MASYSPYIYKIGLTIPVVGGDVVFDSQGNPTGGFSNVQAQQLADRTAYLKKEVEAREYILQAGDNVNIDRTNPSEPVISSLSAVISVNGYVGTVLLGASDVGADPSGTAASLVANREYALTTGKNITIDRTTTDAPIISAKGGADWEVVSASSLTQTGNGYAVNNSTANLVMTLPSTPSSQDRVLFTSLSKANTWVIDVNGSKINGVLGNMTVDTFGGIELVYIDTTWGWIIV